MTTGTISLFVGVDREFKKCFAAWNRERIEEHLVRKGIRWELNPPAASHFGKVWERLVSSYKKAMYAVLGNPSITEDVLSTTMCLLEQTMNARPSTPNNSDVTDLEAITPNHFLLGNQNICLLYFPFAKEFVDHQKFFRQTQAYSSLTWWQIPKRVSANFEQSKQMEMWTWQKFAPSWSRVVDQREWQMGLNKLGRVTKTIKGSDWAIRSATVQTKDRVYRRPVVKFAPVLPIDEDVFTKENRAGDVEAELSKHA